MARPAIVRGTYINILLGNGAEPEVFEPVCGLTTRTFTHQGNTADNFVRDCADPEDVPVRELTPTGEQWDITGAGTLDRSVLEKINAAFLIRKNWRFEIGEPTGDKVYGGYWGGPAMLTNQAITGADETHVTMDIAIASDGVWDFTEVP